MSNRKTLTLFALIALMLTFVLAACGSSSVEEAVQSAADQVEESAAEVVDEAAAVVEEEAAAVVDDAAAVVEEVATEAADMVDEAAATAEDAVAEVTDAVDEVVVDYDTEVYGMIDEIDLDGTTVVFWHQHSGSRGDELISLVEEFNANNEYGITVDARNEGGYSDIYNKMITGLTSGELPGLVVAYQNQAAAYQVADGLISLDPYINDPVYGLSEEDQADFFESFINADRLPQFGNESFGFPPNRSTELMYFNSDWLAELAEAGAISFEGAPQTPEQFREATCAAAANPFSGNPDPSFSTGYEITTDASNVASLAFARGVDVYDYENNAFTYNTEELAAALTEMATLLEEGCISQMAEAYGDQTDFGNGKALFTMGSSSGLPFYKSAVDEGETAGFEWSVAPIPYTTSDPSMNIYGASVSIPKTDPATQLASWLFVKYYTSADSQARWARASNYFPVRESVAAGLGDYFTENPAYEVAFNLLEYGKTEPPVAGYDNVRDAVAEAYSRVLSGEDAATVLADLDISANQTLEDAAP